jgi:hypothetical protein
LRTLFPAQKVQAPYFQLLPHSLKSAQNITPPFTATYALFARSWAQERESTPLFSSACALFCKNLRGVA